jgi:hypothetical protein
MGQTCGMRQVSFQKPYRISSPAVTQTRDLLSRSIAVHKQMFLKRFILTSESAGVVWELEAHSD